MNFKSDTSKTLTRKKIAGLITLALAATMTLSAFAATGNSESVDSNADSSAQAADTARQKDAKPSTEKRFLKPRLYFHNKDALKSILNLTDDELKSKLTEYDGDIYKLLEAYGKVEEYKSAVLKLTKEKLDKAVADGKITREKADAMYTRAETAMREFGANVNDPETTTDEKAGKSRASGIFGFDFSDEALEIDLDDLREKMGKAREVFEEFSSSESGTEYERKVWFGLNESALTEILGISEEELKTKLVENDGNIYKVLEEMGKIDEYKAEVLKVTKEALDKAVAEGRITQENADAMYAKSEEVMNSFISGDDAAMFIKPRESDGENKNVFEYFKDKFQDGEEIRRKSRNADNDEDANATSPSNTSMQSVTENKDI